MKLRALIITPASPGSTRGNRVTAERWARILGELGHAVEIAEDYRGQGCDLMIALHAASSAPAIARFRDERPREPLLVALTGTDLYRDLRTSDEARRSLELATRLIALQPLAADEIEEPLRRKVRVILQSLEPVQGAAPPSTERFEICVLGHLRPVKDPFRAAEAARTLPAGSRLHVLHVGAGLEAGMEERARAEQASNPRYTWVGELPRDEALRVLAASRLLVLSSLMEGGANAISEALVHGVPVIASRIPGSIGLLGEDYTGFFPTGDTAALAALLARAESEPAYYSSLREHCLRLAPAFAPERERSAWSELVEEIF